jgi:polysaccharide export outer membrane protein
MFKPMNDQDLTKAVQESEASYVIQKYDYLELEVYTNLGEKIVDPGTTEENNSRNIESEAPTYLVGQNGMIKFPLISELKVEGLTLSEAEKQLEAAYGKYYQQPFVKLNFKNKRVVVLGVEPGGVVVPLENENMRLTEVLALAKAIDKDAKVATIRVMRGDQVMLADLSTVEGYRKNNYIIQPNDIIYVEPVRRPVAEAFRDYGPIFSVILSLTALIVVFVNL